MDGLITGMTKFVAEANAFPCHYGLGLLPAQVANGSCGIRDATIDEDARILSLNALNLTTLDGQYGILNLGCCAAQQCQQWQ